MCIRDSYIYILYLQLGIVSANVASKFVSILPDSFAGQNIIHTYTRDAENWMVTRKVSLSNEIRNNFAPRLSTSRKTRRGGKIKKKKISTKPRLDPAIFAAPLDHIKNASSSVSNSIQTLFKHSYIMISVCLWNIARPHESPTMKHYSGGGQLREVVPLAPSSCFFFFFFSPHSFPRSMKEAVYYSCQ